MARKKSIKKAAKKSVKKPEVTHRGKTGTVGRKVPKLESIADIIPEPEQGRNEKPQSRIERRIPRWAQVRKKRGGRTHYQPTPEFSSETRRRAAQNVHQRGGYVSRR